MEVTRKVENAEGVHVSTQRVSEVILQLLTLSHNVCQDGLCDYQERTELLPLPDKVIGDSRRFIIICMTENANILS